MKFLDEAKIYIKSGDGGPGCVSFRREKYEQFGGPDGGNGGKGGSVIFVTVKSLNTLIDFRYTQHFKAKNGIHGMGRNRTGPSADDLIVRVPVGTQILADDKETLLYDMKEEGMTVIALKGGDGGFGNTHYKSSVNQAPKKFSPGWEGHEMDIWLRLKMIADAGLVGLPNAGKSTFLSVISKATPKIADYPFTTLYPNLGVANINDHEFVVADIPGIIEGASEGMGLGTRFLGHIERTAIHLHLIDITHDDIVGAYKTIRKELKAYGNGLVEKKEIVALNKCDALGKELSEDQARIFEEETGIKPELISTISGENITNILYKLSDTIKASYKKDSEEEYLGFQP